MKRIIFLMVFLLALTGCSKKYTATSSALPNLDPGEDKATLVVLRDTIWGGVIVFETYVDRKFIGETQDKAYLVAKVDPGERYVITVTENVGVAKINFEPGRIYFLNQNIAMGWWKSRTSGFSVADVAQATRSMNSCAYFEYDRSKNAPDLKQSVYEKAVSSYEDDIKKNPEAYGDVVGYKGILYSEFVGKN